MTTTTTPTNPRVPERESNDHKTMPSAAPAAIAPDDTEVSVATYDLDDPEPAQIAAPMAYEESAIDYEYAAEAPPGPSATFTEVWSHKIAVFVREDPKRGLAVALATGFVVGKVLKAIR